jgi:hypothetical protein
MAVTQAGQGDAPVQRGGVTGRNRLSGGVCMVSRLEDVCMGSGEGSGHHLRPLLWWRCTRVGARPAAAVAARQAHCWRSARAGARPGGAPGLSPAPAPHHHLHGTPLAHTHTPPAPSMWVRCQAEPGAARTPMETHARVSWTVETNNMETLQASLIQHPSPHAYCLYRVWTRCHGTMTS